jgi:hypothetical protein
MLIRATDSRATHKTDMAALDRLADIMKMITQREVVRLGKSLSFLGRLTGWAVYPNPVKPPWRPDPCHPIVPEALLRRFPAEFGRCMFARFPRVLVRGLPHPRFFEALLSRPEELVHQSSCPTAQVSHAKPANHIAIVVGT